MIQWQSSTDGITFSDISGQPIQHITSGGITAETWFKAVVSGCGIPAVSNIVDVNLQHVQQ